MMTRQSPSWDLNRFVKTLSYFGVVPILSQINWFQQWFGSRPDPTVNSRSLTLSPTPTSLPTAPALSMMPQTILAIGTRDVLTAVVDHLQQQGKPIRAGSIDSANPHLPIGENVEWVTLDLQQPPAPELLTDIRGIICAPNSEVVEPTVRFLLQAVQRSTVRLPIFDFSQQSASGSEANRSEAELSEIWGALDDVVMGGVSQSGIRLNGDTAEFSGQVSTANSGGFASVRTRNLEPPIDLSSYDGIELQLKGDGNRYKFMLRGETQWDGVAHCASFDTIPQTWITVRIPFATLIPVFRARTLPNAPLKLNCIRALQLMLSKFEYDGALNPHFQPGFFQLQVQSISAYQQGNRSPFVLVCPPSPETEILLRQSGLPVMILRPAEGDDAAKIAADGVRAIDRLEHN
ncbi:CIA30 family protein [Cyanobacteria bacterium FACHB-502]|nr:CIA30 family protein [Cyanobacteria bacterium FACHB-502]MBD2024255.1 CIA30 family protein [Leptolyngbya sp. FACHB-711]